MPSLVAVDEEQRGRPFGEVEGGSGDVPAGLFGSVGCGGNGAEQDWPCCTWSNTTAEYSGPTGTAAVVVSVMEMGTPGITAQPIRLLVDSTALSGSQ